MKFCPKCEVKLKRVIQDFNVLNVIILKLQEEKQTKKVDEPVEESILMFLKEMKEMNLTQQSK